MPGRPATTPFVFIVGCPRSGTTLLQRIVNAHPHVAITPETQWVPKYYERRIGLTSTGNVTHELIPELMAHRTFHKLGISARQLENLIDGDELVSYARFVSGIYALFGEARGKPLVGDKTPEYCRRIRVLHALWPNAKFVHLVRDGRDVCLSAFNWRRKADRMAGLYTTWASDPVTTAALWWERNVQRGREKGQSLGPSLYYEMRYESLVVHPAEQVAQSCAFLGVPYDDAMLRFHEGRTAAGPDLDAKHGWRPITPGLRDWRTQMPAADVERFEAAAGDLLDELGYPRAVPRPGAAALERAAKIREVFVRDTQARASALCE
jgi:hypothetical protein